MKMSKALTLLLCLCAWADLASAQYVVVLKNGRQLTVQSYREEGSTVKIQGLGGELGIPKEQIQSISKSGQTDRPGLNISNLDNSSRAAPVPAKPIPSAPASRQSEISASTDINSGVSADEEKEYRERLAEITQKLESARTRYLEASSAGNTGAKFDKEGIRSWTADLASRIQDSQKAGGGPASTPLAWSFPAPYTPKAKELSDMRMDIDKLEKERNDLIQEMKSKNIEP
jgi:hypothetical protein